MKRQDLIERVAESGLSKQQARSAVECFFNAITDELARGGQVQLTGFGSFRVNERAARTARDPRTGKAVKVPAHKAPAFKAGAVLKKAVDAERRMHASLNPVGLASDWNR